MAYQTMTLPAFGSVRMDLCEGLLKPDMSPEAYNADPRRGDQPRARRRFGLLLDPGRVFHGHGVWH